MHIPIYPCVLLIIPWQNEHPIRTLLCESLLPGSWEICLSLPIPKMPPRECTYYTCIGYSVCTYYDSYFCLGWEFVLLYIFYIQQDFLGARLGFPPYKSVWKYISLLALCLVLVAWRHCHSEERKAVLHTFFLAFARCETVSYIFPCVFLPNILYIGKIYGTL